VCRLVLNDADSREGCGLRLRCSLRLCHNINPVYAVAQPNNSGHVAFEELHFLLLTDSASLLNRGKLDRDRSIRLEDLDVHDGTVVHVVVQVVLYHPLRNHFIDVVLGEAHLQRDVCNLQASHLFGVYQGC